MFSKQEKILKYAKKALKLQAKGRMEDAGKYLQKQYKKNTKSAKYGKKAAKLAKKVIKNKAYQQSLSMSVSEFEKKYGSGES